jgi:hypothetical protein
LRGEVDRLLGGAALSVYRRAGYMFGKPSCEPGGPRDIPGLYTDGVDAAEDDIVDCCRVDMAT